MTSIGIDFGNTSVRIMVNNIIIPDEFGNLSMPSCISFVSENDVLVGVPAIFRQHTNPLHTIFDINKFLCMNSENMYEFPYKYVTDNGINKIQITFGEYTVNYLPEQIISYIFKKMKSNAEKYTGKLIRDIVLSVPDLCTDSHREILKNSCYLSGLNTLRLVKKSILACCSCGLGIRNFEKKANILYCKIGGTSFDTSVLNLDEYLFEVLESNSDLTVGGRDIDIRLANYCVGKLDNFDIYSNIIKTLIEKCEQVKKNLSFIDEDVVSISEIDIKITLDDFNIISEPIFTRYKDHIGYILSKYDINHIILAGNSMKIKEIRRIFDQHIKDKPITILNNDDVSYENVIAKGAVIQADIFNSNNYNYSVIDDNAYLCYTLLGLGIEINGFKMYTIIEANKTVPYKNTARIKMNNIEEIKQIKIYEGMRCLTKYNRHVKTINIGTTGLTSDFIDVTFDVDADKNLSVTIGDIKVIINSNEFTTSRQIAAKIIEDAQMNYYLDFQELQKLEYHEINLSLL